MSNQWYVYKDRQQQGPFTWEQLWEQARSGRLQPADQVWQDGLSGWLRADQVQGLLAVFPPPLPVETDSPYTPPYTPPAVTEKRKVKRLLFLIILLILVGGGGAAGFYFFSVGGGDLAAVIAGRPSVIGSWSGVDDYGVQGYFQFQKDGKVHLAFPSQGYWSTAAYRVKKEGQETYLEFSDPGGIYDHWEKVAVVEFAGDNLVLTAVPGGEKVVLNLVSDSEFEEVISLLKQVAFPLVL